MKNEQLLDALNNIDDEILLRRQRCQTPWKWLPETKQRRRIRAGEEDFWYLPHAQCCCSEV